MKKLLGIFIVVLGGFSLTACNNMSLSGQAAPISSTVQAVIANHPALSDQEQLLPCFECHKDVTPIIYSDWYNSSHGIGNVKCYQCHGTYEQLTKVPAMDQCAACHAGEMDHSVDATPCWQCHLTHKFTGH